MWVQFFNNLQCGHGSPGFSPSVQSWSQTLANSEAKLFVAVIANESQGSGYIDPPDVKVEAKQVIALGLPNFGGYALWDASLAIENNNLDGTIKSALV